MSRATTLSFYLSSLQLPVFAEPSQEGLASDEQGTKGSASTRKARTSRRNANPQLPDRESLTINKPISKTSLEVEQGPIGPKDDRPFDRKVYAVHATTRRIRTGPLIRIEDARLVALALEGNPTAYNELVERYQNAARNRALAVVRDYQAAEDIVQDAFIKAYNALATLEDKRKFSGWLFTIVQHTALDFVRSRKENMSLETMKEQGYEAPRDTRGLQIEKMEEREEDYKVLEALGQMRSDYMEIIVLKHVEKLSYKEIADRLNMSVSAVGEKLSRVRGILKRKLEKKKIRSAEEENAEIE